MKKRFLIGLRNLLPLLRSKRSRRLFRVCFLASLMISLLIIKDMAHHSVTANPAVPSSNFAAHPLPEQLMTWSSGDPEQHYFSEIKTLPLGYLVWSNFPVRVYVGDSHFSDTARAEKWSSDVKAAIAEWKAFFPLTLTDIAEEADINIQQERPKRTSNGRIRSAQATPKAFCKGDRLQHRFKIEISPSQTGQYIKAATRHELGHALGLWGHSQNANDVMYFSQTRNPAGISERDMNTLKKVYQQPTLLGWASPYCNSEPETSTDSP